MAGLKLADEVAAGAEPRQRRPLLLCELHAHTTWSDGSLTMRELVDLYGRQRFDVVCITDHTVRAGDPMPTAVDSDRWRAYLNELEREAERARRTYGLLLIPGLELTDNRSDPDESAHALAVGLRRFVSMEDGVVPAILEARDAGAAIIAAHPYAPGDATPLRPSLRFFHERDVFRSLVDRWELFNRREIFSWIALNGLRGIAPATFTVPSICRRGRRCCRASGTRTPSSPFSVRSSTLTCCRSAQITAMCSRGLLNAELDATRR
jgi:predicted metal-dependent phosphoesterase TrpH